ncbi:unnamed protein product [Lactuca virosa]|uniref:Isopropylmalate dehydrogenase-like domain-containing protein n=1 Tax=Lactuca virosa TaxID=75947 RepID=A0AAU9PKC8_9ASTR|nr:unnamed protein product [Lactuca virosa]
MALQIARRFLRIHTADEVFTATFRNPTNRLFSPTDRRNSSSSSDLIRATLFPGDGIGPEIATSVKQIFNDAEIPIEWEEHYVGTEVDPRTQSFVTWESLESVRRNKVGLKGPMATPIVKGHRSLNLTLRKELNLYANVRTCYSLPGHKTRYDDVNLITIREKTEGEYSGLEHQVVRGVVESLKIITRHASLRVAEYAFHYTKAHGRKRVSAIHKANIMQKTDGLFLKRKEVHRWECQKNQSIKSEAYGKCIKFEAYGDAVRFYTGAMPIFKAYRDSSLQDCKKASEEGLALGIALIVYGREVEVDTLIEQMTRDQEAKKGVVVFYATQFDGIQKKLSEFNNALGSDPIAEGETSEVDAKYRDLLEIEMLGSSVFQFLMSNKRRRLVISSDGVWDALSGGQQSSTVHQVITN